MKKILCLALAILMLTAMVGCQSMQDAATSAGNLFGDGKNNEESAFDALKEEKEAAEAKESEIEAAARQEAKEEYGARGYKYSAFKGNTEEKAQVLADAAYSMNEYIRYNDSTWLNYKYAIMLEEEDFPEIAPLMKEWMYYKIPFNVGEELAEDGTNKFLTPKECTEMNSDLAPYLCDLAAAYLTEMYSADPTNDTVESIQDRYEQFLTKGFAEQMAILKYTNIQKNQCTQVAIPLTSPSLVYNTSSGKVAVRVLLAYKTTAAPDEYLKRIDATEDTIGVWYVSVVDIYASIDEESYKMEEVTDVDMTAAYPADDETAEAYEYLLSL